MHREFRHPHAPETEKRNPQSQTFFEFTSWPSCTLLPITFHCNCNKARCRSSCADNQNENTATITQMYFVLPERYILWTSEDPIPLEALYTRLHARTSKLSSELHARSSVIQFSIQKSSSMM